MEAFAQVLNVAIPVFLLLIGVEYFFSRRAGRSVYRLFDAVSSLSSGMTNVIKDVVGLSVVIVSYGWLYNHLALMDIQSNVLLYIIAFIGLDFAGYWIHRWSHVVNLFWNRHIIHHSSEEFNLSCALRQSVSDIVALFTFTYIPMALLGVPPEVVGVVAPLHLFAQFWYHTRLIGRMGWLEHIIVTPSHHRVHHAINPEYMDRNYGQIFILWDKWFGTFQEEKTDVAPVYGVTRPVRTWNPWLINYMHLWLLIQDAWRTSVWKNKVVIWFMPTGWRPADVAAKYPVMSITDVGQRLKYETSGSAFFRAWTVCQLLVTLALMIFLFSAIGELTFTTILFYGVFLFVTIFAYTSQMDGSVLGVVAEMVKCGMAAMMLWLYGGQWFGLDNLLPGGTYYVTGYLGLSMLLAVYFYVADRPVAVTLEEENLIPGIA